MKGHCPDGDVWPLHNTRDIVQNASPGVTSSAVVKNGSSEGSSVCSAVVPIGAIWGDGFSSHLSCCAQGAHTELGGSCRPSTYLTAQAGPNPGHCLTTGLTEMRQNLPEAARALRAAVGEPRGHKGRPQSDGAREASGAMTGFATNLRDAPRAAASENTVLMQRSCGRAGPSGSFGDGVS